MVMLLPHLSMLLAVMVAGPALDIRSGTNCPSGEAIADKLAPLLPGMADAGDVAWIDLAAPEPAQRPALRVRLVRADTSVIADRRLTIQGGCDEMADTVATILAAWEAPPAPLPAILSDTNKFHGEPAKDIQHLELWVGAAGGAGLLGGIAAAGNIELVLQHTGSHLLGRAAMTGQTTRQVNMDPGDGVWRRTYGSLGLGWQARRPASHSTWQASANLGLLLGWLTASGRGFTRNSQETAFELGASAGLRGQRRLGNWALWLEARANFWPNSERTVLTGASSEAQLPKFDVLASFGVSRLVLR